MQILSKTSSTRCIIYEMHHLQDYDLLDTLCNRCIMYEIHGDLFLCVITALLVHI